MSSKTPPGQTATRVAPAIMLILIVAFILQLLFIDSTFWQVAVGVILIAALGATIGWLVTALRRDNDGVTGI